MNGLGSSASDPQVGYWAHQYSPILVYYWRGSSYETLTPAVTLSSYFAGREVNFK